MLTSAPLPSARAAAVVLSCVALAAALAVPAAPPARAAGTPVMGRQQATVDQLVRWYASTGKRPDLPISVRELASLFLAEGAAEGVRGDIAFAQSILETAYFTFPSAGQVRPSHNNYAGIGAVDGGNNPNRFPSPRIGVRAQIQHLRAYADRTVTAGTLAHPLVDPRFRYVSPKGKAPTWERLSGTWATDRQYGAKILALWGRIAATGTVQVTAAGLPEGLFVQRGDGARFLVEKGRARRVLGGTAGTFGWRRSHAVTGLDRELARLPAGADLRWRPGTLLETPEGKRFVWDGRTRRRILSDVWRARGYAAAALVPIPVTQTRTTAVGRPLTAGEHVVGDVVRFTGDAHAHEVVASSTGPRLRRIPTAGVHSSRHGDRPAAVRPATAPRPSAGGPIGFRTGTMLRTDDGQLWLVSGTVRRPVTGSSALAARLRALPARAVTDAEAALHPVGEPIR